MSQRDEHGSRRNSHDANAHSNADVHLRPQDAARRRLPSLGLSQSRSDLFEADNDPPPTPPYRLDASKSQEVIERAHPPDYEREHREHKHEHKPSGAHVHYTEDDSGQHARPARPTPSRTFSAVSATSAGSDLEDDLEEDYNWSDDEDLLDQEAKFEQKTGQRKKVRTGCGIGRIIIFFFSTLIGSTITAGLLAVAPILLRIYYLKPHRTEHRTYVTNTVSAWLFWAAANVLISWYIAVLIDLIPHIIAFAVDTVWGTVSEQLKGRIEVYNATKGWIKPPFYAATAWVAWYILFANIFKLYNPSDEHASLASYTPIVYQVIIFLFFLTLLYCIQKMFTQFIAISFHRTAYKERLDEVNTAIKVIDHLRDYKPKRKTHAPQQSSGYFGSRVEPMELEEGLTDSGKGKAKAKSKGWFRSGDRNRTKSHSRSRSRSSSPGGSNKHSYPPRRSTPDRDGADELLAQAARTVKRAVMHDARNMRGGNGNGGYGGAGGDDDETGLKFKMGSTKEAKKVARDIYFAFKQDRRRQYLIPADFFPAYPTPDEARAAFKVFDTDGNGDITRAEIKTIVVKVYRERRFLSRSMRDISAAIQTLDRILLFFAAVVLFFISLSVFGVAIGNSLTSVYSLGIAASFIFKNAASSAFDAIMFIFVTHPFDTGDRCFIEQENLIVKRMGLFATEFVRADGTTLYYFNSNLFTKFITNVRRSGKQFEGLTLQVDWRTPMSKLDQLEQKMNEWLQSDENRWYDPPTGVMLQHIDFQRCLELTMGIPHNGTWQDWGLRNARKTAFHAAAQFYCRQLGITCGNSPQPVVIQQSRPELEPRFHSDQTVDGDLLSAPDETAAEPSATPAKAGALGFVPPPEEQNRLRQRKSRVTRARIGVW
ncbi:transporter, small conductance mechanosensitive ion channel (MscS) family protein [Ceratobasidium sp. AG-Ba]|nr:transporter, small conductance mechanosensitive ion channel (MscS) family protein [Ceratobasidium sp. AG-Ba]